MILRVIYIVLFIQKTILSLGQSSEQKQIMYEYINNDSRGISLVGKIEPIKNKETLFKNAQVLPVYKVFIDKTAKYKFVQNEKYFLVFYYGRLYYFINGKGSQLFENSPIIKTLTTFNSENKKFKIFYLTESFSFDGKMFNPLFTDDNFSFIIDKESKYNFLEFIESKYGSIEKLKEMANIDTSREKLTSKEINNFIKSDYLSFQYNCPKDTTIILKSLINEIKSVAKDFSSGQELKLMNAIKSKINPFEQVKKMLKKQKLNDSIAKINELELEKMNEELKKSFSKIVGIYEFKIYGVSITNELLEVLTTKQLVDYINFNNLYRPTLDTQVLKYNKIYRYSYGKEVLSKEGIIKNDNAKEFQNYSNKMLEDCGCPFDESIKREVIIR